GWAASVAAGPGVWTNVGIPGAFVGNVEYVGDGVAIAATSGGIYRTTNHGISWTLIHGLVAPAVFSIAVNPANPDQILVTGDDALRSTDRGLSFTHIDVAGSNSASIFAAAFSRDGFYAWLVEDDGEVRRSTDGGATWQIFPGALASGVNWYLESDLADHNTVYAGMGLTLQVSRDGGVTWSHLPADGMFKPRPSLTTPGRVLALQTNSNDGARWSNDYGASWTASTAPAGLFALETAANGRAFAIGYNAHFFSSTDDGATWTDRGRLPNGYGVNIAVDPANPQRILAATTAGVIGSDDGGATWSERNTGLLDAAAWDIVTASNGGTSVYVATGDLGSIYQRNPATGGFSAIGRSTVPLLGYPGMSNSRIAMSPQQPDTLFLLREGRLGRSTNGGSSWGSVAMLPLSNELTIDPQNAQVMYVTGQDLRRKSVDGGLTWAPFGTGLPTLVSNGLGRIYVDPSNSANVYALVIGYSDATSPVYRSTDAGATWTATNWPGTREFTPHALAFEPGRPSTIYLAEEFGPWKSVDSGLHWTPLNVMGGGLDIVVDPQSPQTVYASGRFSDVRRSVDGGATWNYVHELTASASSYPGFERMVLVPGYNAKLLGIRLNGGVYELDVTPRLALGLSPATLTAGTAGSLVLSVDNPGVVTASRVRVTATLPPSAGTYGVVANLGSCTVNQRELSCDIGTLAPAASANITVTLAPTGPGVTNFSVSAYETLSAAGVNSQSLNVLAAQSSSPSGGGGNGGGGRLDYLLLVAMAAALLGRRRRTASRPRQGGTYYRLPLEAR
ncbi:MAG: hypothetical protein ABI769_08085, partial [Pseudomonadota bacterium]